jgi:hypothetical protein
MVTLKVIGIWQVCREDYARSCGEGLSKLGDQVRLIFAVDSPEIWPNPVDDPLIGNQILTVETAKPDTHNSRFAGLLLPE